MQEKGEVLVVQNRLREERQKLLDVAKEVRQLEAVAVAAQKEAEAAALQCLEQSSRTAALLADQQRMQGVLEGQRTAAQAQVCHIRQSSGRFCEPRSFHGPCSAAFIIPAEETFCMVDPDLVALDP